MKFDKVYFFHGRGGSPKGSVSKLAQILRSAYPDLMVFLPALPHSKFESSPKDSLQHVMDWYVPTFNEKTLVVGVSLGGLIAARAQELARTSFTTFSICSPTSAAYTINNVTAMEVVELEKKMENRVALYSSTADDQIKGRCENWPDFTDLAIDVPWLVHDVDNAKYAVSYAISTFMQGKDLRKELRELFNPPELGTNPMDEVPL